jgi:hypothetical protein
MAFGTPPSNAPAAKPKMTLANASAAGTTAGAPTPLSMGPQPGAQQSAPQAPPTGGPPANPVVQKHAVKSVGTHQSASLFKRGNPTHGMSKQVPSRNS